VFLSSYRNACEGLGELVKAVEAFPCGLCSYGTSCSPKLPDRNAKIDFSVANRNTSGSFGKREVIFEHDGTAKCIQTLIQISQTIITVFGASKTQQKCQIMCTKGICG